MVFPIRTKSPDEVTSNTNFKYSTLMPEFPNLLFIFTDEQRADTMACYGNDTIRTPNLNKFAGESFVFEHPYCTQPVCTPSRASIMTGLYPHTHGCVRNNATLKKSIPTVSELIPGSYRKGYIGKWHLGDEVIRQRDFDEWISIEDNYRAYYSRPEYLERLSNYHHFLIQRGLEPQVEGIGQKVFGRFFAANLAEDLTKAAFVSEQAAKFICKNDSRPFALYVNFLEPHMPFTGPFNNLYDPLTLPVGPHFCRKPSEEAAGRNRILSENYFRNGFEGVELSAEKGWRLIRSRYWGLATLVDRAVGRILAALEESSQANKTIVVFTSDHGDMMGDHGLLAKGVMYEGAVGVPLLMRVPWLTRRTRMVSGRVSQVDLVPTLLDLLNQPIPTSLQGRSLRSVLEGKGDLTGNPVVIEWNSSPDEPDEYGIKASPWRTIISPQNLKLNLCVDDQCELYDLNTDPFELKNLFNAPRHQRAIRDLVSRLRAWQDRTDDPVPLSNLHSAREVTEGASHEPIHEFIQI